MSLWDDVRQILSRLSGQGWRPLLLKHGLDLNSSNLPGELQRNLGTLINRDLAGFLDFAALGTRAIEPGDPARSLLYHALASPLVHPTADGGPASPDAYPTREELDTIENLIYALNAPNILTADLALAVFAYEYRPASGTPHGKHADLVFARAGIARNGNTDAEYNPVLRCYRGIARQDHECLVSPSKFGLFLARRVSGDAMLFGANDRGVFVAAGGKLSGDGDREFLMPIHKVFNGPECLSRNVLEVEFHHRHVNEKLHRAATTKHGITVPPVFDTAAPPFKIVSEGPQKQPGPDNGPIQLDQLGSVAIVRPLAGDLIVEAKQRSVVDNVERLVTFTVPEAVLIERINRRFTSFRIAEDVFALAREGLGSLLENVFSWLGGSDRFPRPRNAPEFINIRHRVLDNEQISDMRTSPPLREDFQKAVRNGGYEAALFVDGCADGCVTAKVTVTGTAILAQVRPAFSIVAPPDFFPSIDQGELMQWLKANKVRRRDLFKQGGPEPLSMGRLAANQDMMNPLTAAAAFSDGDETLVAMVSWAPRIDKLHEEKPLAAFSDTSDRTSFLPDASSTVFAPGWDVTYAAHETGKPFYATYGLGSPFPEDVKLCAAANSFWPAVSPDASRTFGRADAPTAMPLMDGELGYHDHHLRVQKGVARSNRGWDGEQGPFLTGDGLRVNYADIERSDYVANLRDGLMSFRQLAQIDADEMGRRMDALRVAVKAADNGKTPAETSLWLISAEAVPDWSAVPAAGLAGGGYRYVFAKLKDKIEHPVDSDPARLERTVSELVRCRVSRDDKRVERAPAGSEALELYDL